LHIKGARGGDLGLEQPDKPRGLLAHLFQQQSVAGLDSLEAVYHPCVSSIRTPKG